jgi:hypothetical protein
MDQTTYLPKKMEQTERSKMSAHKIEMPGNNPEENIQHSEHSKSLKSRIVGRIIYDLTKVFMCIITFF